MPTPPAFLDRLILRARKEMWLHLALLLLAASGLALSLLADAVLDGATQHLDRALMLALRDPADPALPIGPHWLALAARDITALGGYPVLTVLTLAALGFLLMLGKRRTSLLLLVSVGGGALLSTLLKHGYARPRPDLVPHAVETFTASFPSGHAMLSAATYLTLGALLARVQPRRRVKRYLLGVAVLLTLLIGSSRVFLGVHWPTDVLAGWGAGAAWAMICWMLALWLQRRGEIEPTTTDTPDAEPG
ncbi:phosphatase PAP2 family protein [Oleisolibacter albus]|uniref:phosphatase PAP2 family protein n=1 Tax=Oleisolibacter albus TaxID=2171757 RepID=UPI000DF27900|nr:phosphatase PAP2 family protein [Oleisolibacter albus]